MRFAQILNNKAHWVFETDKKPEFAPNIVLVDITDNPKVQEGWDYDEEKKAFSEPAESIIEDLSMLIPSDEEVRRAEFDLWFTENAIEMEMI